MRQFLAILRDSMRESLDRRALIVMLALSLLPIIFCFGLSFEAESLDEVLVRQAQDMMRPRALRRLEVPPPEVGEVAPIASTGSIAPTTSMGEPWSPALAGGRAVSLTFGSAADLDAMAVAWFERSRRLEEVPDVLDGEPRGLLFLRERFAQFGYQQIEVKWDGQAIAWIAVQTDEPAAVRNAHKVSLFGVIDLDPEMSIASFVTLIQAILSGVIVGFVGILVALFACSGFVPNMVQKGTLDLALARPISRTKLLLSKYVGGLFFVFCIAAFAVTGSWLGLFVGSGYGNPAFLVCIPTLTFTFGLLYAVAVWVGITMRSSGMSALIAIGVWFLSSAIHTARTAMAMFQDAPGWLVQGVDVLYWVLPKIKDIDYINARVLSGGVLSPEVQDAVFEGEIIPEVDWVLSLGSSAAFAAVVLLLAIRQFRRRDY